MRAAAKGQYADGWASAYSIAAPRDGNSHAFVAELNTPLPFAIIMPTSSSFVWVSAALRYGLRA